MGDLLCFISLICSSPDPVEILVSNEHGTYDTLCNMKRVLNIPDHRFTLSLSVERGQFPNYGWPLKLFSPYYRPELVNIFGKDIPVKGAKPSKGYIGLVCYNGSGQYMNNDYHMVQWNHDRTMITGKEVVWPQVRYRPVSYYTRLFEYFKTHDYDVITLDSNTTLFDEKVELMVKYCRAIVGFEGGIAHLSHMLGIPYFMLDWRLPSPSTANGDLHCELVHMSPHLYMLRDDEEIFSWDKAELSHRIYQTELGMGNNRFITGERQFKFDANSILGNIRVTDDKGNEILDMGKLFDNNAMHQFLRKYFNDSHITSKFGKW
jgi:hypothetical protein